MEDVLKLCSLDKGFPVYRFSLVLEQMLSLSTSIDYLMFIHVNLIIIHPFFTLSIPYGLEATGSLTASWRMLAPS